MVEYEVQPREEVVDYKGRIIGAGKTALIEIDEEEIDIVEEAESGNNQTAE